ncbi:helix-turn-helix transcriptional regulator [Clostridium saccharobutylicum]|uniref:Transcriptional regulator n=1 Tax=Clostridium saccharobutylicum DSM 13864 TaxID=1345695 RepID=U5MLI8_CLOSA|nr:helix-turn-helix domain-containing protein [Clostridium saccharobutylicum]AGX41445.1 transcriptional regulator [Clostridium saccharobutylicum DSM 13864]AQR88726.1 helix-turn-helix domain protein [Clostridium saccharobutylicum]AQR98624.1 helix-turn-helix domain protein [Clostridium saccharobutylicum]AQS08345.1 helix-turn-helix domain protein [Clostridium saccharobutylicum]AQS12614.1 helix-turn-helix domain protein [Clostridium saccharobutylicum]
MNKIDKLRKRKALSYNDIAKSASISAQYVYLLAKGKRSNPSLEKMRAIANALDEKVEYVFKIN